MTKNITLGFSPCPNDTFMFDALINKRILSGYLNFIPTITDVEELNRLAFEKKLDVTKLSMNAYAHVASDYEILDAGSALGKNCGPLLVSKHYYNFSEIEKLKIAIPGKFTTANLLLSIFAPNATKKSEIIFSEIEENILNGKFDAGLVIHESRFTYSQRGLKKIADMGELWEQHTHSPIPLGCIALKRNLPAEIKSEINNLLRSSVEFAFSNPQASKQFVKQHSQELSDDVIESHIKLYVNNFSINLGVDGKKAISVLFEKGFEKKILPQVAYIFLSENLKTVS